MGTVFLHGNGGSGSGGTLTVTAPAGVIATISKDGKTKTKTVGSDGLVVFKGLATGTWTLTITDGGDTATKSVSITADYSTSITFFSATIEITYPAGSICTITNGSTVLTAPDTSGSWSCIVPNAGIWTVKATDGSNANSKNVSIADGQSVNVTINYNLYLYNNGDGGWKVAVGEERIVSNSSGLSKSLTINSAQNSISMKEQWGSAIFKTKNKVDLTNYSSLTMHGNIVFNTENANTGLCVWSEIGTYWLDNIVSRTSTVNSSVSLDISKLSGSYYIGFGFYDKSTVELGKLFLEV